MVSDMTENKFPASMLAVPDNFQQEEILMNNYNIEINNDGIYDPYKIPKKDVFWPALYDKEADINAPPITKDRARMFYQ